jgi:DNA-binding protein Fis
VAQCLERCRGNRTRAAAELGISRQALLAKLKKMGLTE